MKTKRFEKKLVLNRKTIANLDVENMKRVLGGEDLISLDILCPPYRPNSDFICTTIPTC